MSARLPPLHTSLGFGSRVLKVAGGCDISVRHIFSVWMLGS